MCGKLCNVLSDVRFFHNLQTVLKTKRTPILVYKIENLLV